MKNQNIPHPDKPTTKSARRQWYVELVLGAVALGVAYLAATLAIDTGSLLTYGVALVFAALGGHHFMRAFRAWRGAFRGR